MTCDASSSIPLSWSPPSLSPLSVSRLFSRPRKQHCLPSPSRTIAQLPAAASRPAACWGHPVTKAQCSECSECLAAQSTGRRGYGAPAASPVSPSAGRPPAGTQQHTGRPPHATPGARCAALALPGCTVEDAVVAWCGVWRMPCGASHRQVRSELITQPAAPPPLRRLQRQPVLGQPLAAQPQQPAAAGRQTAGHHRMVAGRGVEVRTGSD